MRSSNPFMGSLTNNQNQQGSAQGYNQQSYGQYGAGQYASMGGVQTASYHDNMPQAENYGVAGASDRPMTVDDVVTKTGITLGVIILGAVITFFLGLSNPAIAMGLTFVGMIGGLITVLISTFGKKYGSAPITLTYAAFEGLFVGGFSWMVAGSVTSSGVAAGAMIFQAVLGTLGVFVGMLFVYKTGAIRVTPKFTRMLVGAMIGVLVMSIGSLVIGMFGAGAGPLRDGGPMAWIFSLVCIGLAAMSFLVDFDQADKLVRSGAPSKMAWGVAMGLAITLVWLYTEILRLLQYINRD